MYASSKYDVRRGKANDLDLHLAAANDCLTVAHQRYVTADRRRQLLEEYAWHKAEAGKLLSEPL